MKLINKTLILSILFTYNNIFFTLTTIKGKILIWNSVGFNKIKGTKKITLNAVKINLKYFFLLFQTFKFHIKLKGLSKHKKIVLKNLKESNLIIISIYDDTNLAHNGCKLKKLRRI